MSQHYKKGKLSISEMDLYDVPMLGIFAYDKTYTAYTLKVLAGIEVENPSTLEVRMEDFLSNLDNAISNRL